MWLTAIQLCYWDMVSIIGFESRFVIMQQFQCTETAADYTMQQLAIIVDIHTTNTVIFRQKR